MKREPFTLLEGDDQVGPFAQFLLKSDKSLPKAVSPTRALKDLDFSRFAVSVVDLSGAISEDLAKDPEWAEGPTLDEIFAVQPLSGPPAREFCLDIVDGKDSIAEMLAEALEDGELLKEYEYGGLLSGRGGFFVVHRDRPDRVLRYVQTWMS